MAKLTAKQQRFCDEYLIDLNATQAAIRAGYSPNTAMEQGHQLLQKTSVSGAIEAALAERSRRTGVNADRVVRELAKIAFLNPADVVDSYGRIKENASPDDLACIQGIKYEETDSGVKREIKFCSKEKALELLGKHLGIYTDRVDQTVDMELNVHIDYGDG